MNKLSNKVAVITGGSSGIGLATAQRFIEEGAVVYVTGRRQQELEAAAAKVGAIAVQGDVSDPADLDRLYDTVRGDGRRIDVLVTNVGTAGVAMLEDITDELFDKIFDINVKGTLKTVQKALPLLNDGASIVLVGSVSGSTSTPGYSVYGASKAAVRSFARGWASELKGRNIRVNTVAPGTTDTPGIGSGADDDTRREFMANLSSQVPLGRWGRPEEQADAILFLASEQSSYITGFELVVDGGATQLGPFG
ncbi:SDR family oxidoreductase [Streptomyces sp. HC44]|uniref:SDR family oxidoreductase n=1 Tax=Streptomyces scabichelini TaxID=2711217 RepID=A0A6G4V4Q2_9ACTN|nr:glucose 1-dehydrogenase [Streptomyces scabichelini]NGO08951.1 SDR family oxidoreductase [Streptomyces scabichelini]